MKQYKNNGGVYEHVKINDGIPEGWAKTPLSRLCVDDGIASYCHG